jgi:KaiC/GvpD/RAD55 family RecA-like ATPase
VSALLDGLEDKERRRSVLSLAALLSRLSLTTLLTAELDETEAGLERYATSGVIRLMYQETEKSVKRRLRIVKMRETMHSMDIIPYAITAKGIELIV